MDCIQSFKKTKKFIFCDCRVWYIKLINTFILQHTVQNTLIQWEKYVILLDYPIYFIWDRCETSGMMTHFSFLQMECQLPTWCSQAWFLYSQIWMIWWTMIPFKVGNSSMPICPDHTFLNSSLRSQRYCICFVSLNSTVTDHVFIFQILSQLAPRVTVWCTSLGIKVWIRLQTLV